MEYAGILDRFDDRGGLSEFKAKVNALVGAREAAANPLKAAAEVRDALAPYAPLMIRVALALSIGLIVYTFWSRSHVA